MLSRNKYHLGPDQELPKFFKAFSSLYNRVIYKPPTACICIMGFTGAGKTTVSSIVAQNKKLTGMKNLETGEIELTYDHDNPQNKYLRIGNSLHSETQIPNVIPLDSSFQSMRQMVDICGFKDTFGIVQEIINFYYTKKLFPNLEFAKFALVIPEGQLTCRTTTTEDHFKYFCDLFESDEVFRDIIGSTLLVLNFTDKTQDQCQAFFSQYYDKYINQRNYDQRVASLLQSIVVNKLVVPFKKAQINPDDEKKAEKDQRYQIEDEGQMVSKALKALPTLDCRVKRIIPKFPIQNKTENEEFIKQIMDKIKGSSLKLKELLNDTILKESLTSLDQVMADSDFSQNLLAWKIDQEETALDLASLPNIDFSKDIYHPNGLNEVHSLMASQLLLLHLCWDEEKKPRRKISVEEMLKILIFHSQLEEEKQVYEYCLSALYQMKELADMFIDRRTEYDRFQNAIKDISIPTKKVEEFMFNSFWHAVKSKDLTIRKKLKKQILWDQFERVKTYKNKYWEKNMNEPLLRFWMLLLDFDESYGRYSKQNHGESKIHKELQNIVITGVEALDNCNPDERTEVIDAISDRLQDCKFFLDVLVFQSYLNTEMKEDVVETAITQLDKTQVSKYSNSEGKAKMYFAFAKIACFLDDKDALFKHFIKEALKNEPCPLNRIMIQNFFSYEKYPNATLTQMSYQNFKDIFLQITPKMDPQIFFNALDASWDYLLRRTKKREGAEGGPHTSGAVPNGVFRLKDYVFCRTAERAEGQLLKKPAQHPETRRYEERKSDSLDNLSTKSDSMDHNCDSDDDDEDEDVENDFDDAKQSLKPVVDRQEEPKKQDEEPKKQDEAPELVQDGYFLVVKATREKYSGMHNGKLYSVGKPFTGFDTATGLNYENGIKVKKTL